MSDFDDDEVGDGFAGTTNGAFIAPGPAPSGVRIPPLNTFHLFSSILSSTIWKRNI